MFAVQAGGASAFHDDPYDAGTHGVVKSAKRVLELFEFVAEHRQPFGVTEVVRALNWPQSSVSALLASLVKLGYLYHDRHARLYGPTVRVALLGACAGDVAGQRTGLLQLAEELGERTGLTVMIGTQNGIHVQYVHVVQASQPEVPQWYVRPGSLRPLCRTAVGRVLLSLQPDLDIARLLRRVNAEETDAGQRVNSAALLDEIAQVRLHGYACTEGTLNPHGGAIAIQLPVANGHPAMAIGIGSPLATLNAGRAGLLQLLRDSVQRYAVQFDC